MAFRNQRNPNKKLVGTYLDVSDVKKIKKLADDNGLTQSELLKAVLTGLDDDIAMIKSKISMLKRREKPSTVAG